VTPEVGRIDTVQSGGRWSGATSSVTVVDADAPGTALAGVSVTGRWYVDGAPQGTATATTGADGTATLSSPTYKVRGATVTFCATRLSGTGVTTVDYTPDRCTGVLDAGPADPTDPETPTEPGGLEITDTTVTKVRGLPAVTLTWSGAAGPVHVLRDGVRLTGEPVSGTSYRDTPPGRSGTVRYRVCAAAEPAQCSPEVTVTY
jgi:hypothetical protein